MKLIHVAPDRWNFEDEDGVFFTPFGANVLTPQHPVQGTLFDHFDADDVERRFAAMQAFGLNTLRQPIGVNTVFDPRTGLKVEGMRHWHRFMELAEQCDVRLIPVGGYLGSNDWFDAAQLADDGQPLDDSCAFWAAFVPEFADHPAVFAWDLRNELLYDAQDHALAGGGTCDATVTHLCAGWPAYLEARYGTVALMNRQYQGWGRFTDFSEPPTFIRFTDDPGNPIAADFRHYLNEKGYAWSKCQVEVIRAASPRHMVCSGNNGWLFPDMDLWLANGFHNRTHHDLYDFISIHPYPAPQCLPTGHGDPLDGGEALSFWLDAVAAMARMDYYGKPVVLQEFGWYGGGESRFLCPLPFRSEEAHAGYLAALIEHLLPHANGFINWPLCDMPEAEDISNHGGLFTDDLQSKAAAEVFHNLVRRVSGKRQARASGTRVMACSLLLLFTSRAYQDTLWEEIHTLSQQGETLDFRCL
ncbi:MAG: beta-galactosidase [Armatimonadota bacterium]